jgi:uncharacterized protein (TIGR02145 family)
MKIFFFAILILLFETFAQEDCPVPVARTPFVLSIGKFTDARDKKTYKTTKIGHQVWMAENLNYSAEGSKCYGNLETNCAKYGRLYDWETAKGSVCPSGWRLPTGDEWQAVVDFGISGAKLKAKKSWGDNGNGTDNYEFSALPGGRGNSYGDFIGIGFDGTWWSQASAYYGGGAWVWNMYHNNSEVNRSSGETNLRSIRCVMDEQCNGKSYNPSTQKCSDDGKTVLTRCGRRGDNYYNASTHFCSWHTDGIYEKCNNETYEPYNVYNPERQFCFRGKGYNRVYNKCGTHNEYNPSTHFCSNDNLKKYNQFVDSRDRKTYKITKIGTQTWIAENLNYSGTTANTIGKCFENDTTNCNIFGRLYNFAEAKSACPKGWHLPNNKEWVTLIKYAGDSLTAAVKLKSMNWAMRYFDARGYFDKKTGTDDFGFTALPGGTGNLKDNFYNSNQGYWWSATENYWNLKSDGYGWSDQNPTKPEFTMGIDIKSIAISSIRCIQD